jgi:hypothetical protein
MARCENPSCGKMVVPIEALSMRIPEVDDEIHFFCDAKCALEANEAWERMKAVSQSTEPDA